MVRSDSVSCACSSLTTPCALAEAGMWEETALDAERRKVAQPTIVFDEAHKAKNLIDENNHKSGGTKTGKAVMLLQKLLPNARIVCASATGVSQVRLTV